MLCFMAKNASKNRAIEKNEDIHKFVFDLIGLEVNFGLQWSGRLGNPASNN